MFEGLKKKLAAAVKGFVKKDEDELKAEAQKETQGAQLQTVEEAVIKAEKEAQAAPKVQEPPLAHAAVPPPLIQQNHEAQPPPAQQIKSDMAPEPIKIAPSPQAAVALPERGKEQRQEIIRLSLKTKLKSVFIKTVLLNENEIDDFTENIRISLLESDVSYDAADAFIDALKGHLAETKIDSRNIQAALLQQVRLSLFDILNKSGSGIDISNFVNERVSHGKAPVKILFLGPNGTGKTTTIAKIAHGFKKQGIGVVLSASDTFRAAAIEQTEHHAKRVGVPVIKSTYGADPASIAFDAIAYAKAHDQQVVLIDSAGRQETNRNLISEMQKIVRVASPDMVVFVGESTSGNALSEQIREFSKFIKIDGIILTKLDVDAKGGNAISIAYTTGIPILFLGTGESYDALVKYTPDFIVNSIVPNN